MRNWALALCDGRTGQFRKARQSGSVLCRRQLTEARRLAIARAIREEPAVVLSTKGNGLERRCICNGSFTHECTCDRPRGGCVGGPAYAGQTARRQPCPLSGFELGE